MSYRVDKPWGYEIIFAKTRRYVGKVLYIKSGEELSLQFHRKKDETIYIFSGHINFHYGDDVKRLRRLTLKKGDSFHISPHMIHKIIAKKHTFIFEVSTSHLDDVVRLKDKYGREGTSKP